MFRYYVLVVQYSTTASQRLWIQPPVSGLPLWCLYDLPCVCLASPTSSHSPKTHTRGILLYCFTVYCYYIISLLLLFPFEQLDTRLLVCWIVLVQCLMTTMAWTWGSAVLQQIKSSPEDPRQECNEHEHCSLTEGFGLFTGVPRRRSDGCVPGEPTLCDGDCGVVFSFACMQRTDLTVHHPSIHLLSPHLLQTLSSCLRGKGGVAPWKTSLSQGHI